MIVSDDFPNKGELSFQNLLCDCGDVVEGFPDVFIFDVIISNFLPCDLLNPADGSVVENFEFC